MGLTHRETNLRYLALESMCLLATSEFSHDAVKKHQETVINALKTERDVSVGQRAVDLLYAMCDRSNSEDIVLEMLTYLETADYSIREEMVLKVAILAEKYATDYKWYVDVILNLIRLAGDYVSEEVWYRVIQIVINREDVQGYAAKTVFEALQAPACHENMGKVGGYILGEFGNLIAGDARSAPLVQFRLLHSKYHLCSIATRGLLLTTYVKFINLFPEIKTVIEDIFKTDSNLRSSDAELQQRACEYLALSRVATLDVLATVLEEMPPFPEKESSGLLNLLKKKRPGRVPENPEIKSSEDGETPAKPKATMVNLETSVNNSSSGSADLLGLGLAGGNGTGNGDGGTEESPSVNGNGFSSETPTNNLTNTLIRDGGTEESPSVNGNGFLQENETNNFSKFYCKNNGVLYENDTIQIGIKTECRANLARMALFYGNKTSFPFINFQPNVTLSPELTSSLTSQVKSVDSTVEAGAQFQQMVNIECLADFTAQPDLNVNFTSNGRPHKIPLKIPISINKFMQPTEMVGDAFFARWKNLSAPGQEAQKIYKAVYPMDPTQVKTKLIGYGFSLLEGVDPNPDNYVSAGIIHTKTIQIGCLMRLEPNHSANMYRLTVRLAKTKYHRLSAMYCRSSYN